MQTRYVNTASTTGGNGTTNDIAGTNRAFPNLNEALFYVGSPLYDDWTVFCSGTTRDTTLVQVQALNTNGYTLLVRPNTGNQAGLTFYSNRYCLGSSSPVSTSIIEVGSTSASGLVFDGIQIDHNQTAWPSINMWSGILRNCFIRCTDATDREGPRFFFSGKVYLINTIMVSKIFTTSEVEYTVGLQADGSNYPKMYNCIVVGGGPWTVSITDDNMIMKNCYVAGASGGTAVSYQHGGISYCATNDTSLSGHTGCLTNVAYSTSSGAYFTNVTFGSEDFTISSLASALRGVGISTVTEPYPLNFTTDLRGYERSVTSWDIGAGGTPLNPFISSFPRYA